MNKCSRCGAYVPVEQSFCQNCGASMTEQPDTTAAQQRGQTTAPNNLAETIAVPSGSFNAPSSNPSMPPPTPPSQSAYAPTQYNANPSPYPAPSTSTYAPSAYPPPAATPNAYQAAISPHQTGAPNFSPTPTGVAPRKSRKGLYIGLGLGAVVLVGIIGSVILMLVLALNSTDNNNSPNTNNANIARNQNAANTANANAANRNGAVANNSGGRNDEDPDSANDQPISDRK